MDIYSVNKIKIGLIGLNFGKILIQKDIIDVGSPGHRYFEIIAVCSHEAAEADAAASQWKVTPYYSIDDMLADKNIEAVCLMTGPCGRANLIRQIIRAGKDVMTTKPFELDASEAESVLDEARALNRTVHLNSPSPMPADDLMQIKQWQKEYNLGRAIGAHCQTWCNYRETPDDSWYDDADKCPVAPLFRLGIYLINDLLWFFNDPQEIQVLQSRIFTGRPTPDNGLMSIKFADGALASIYASFCIQDSNPYPDSLTLNFENGTINRNVGTPNGMGHLAVNLQLLTGRPGSSITQEVILEEESRSGAYMWNAFYKAINDNTIANATEPKQVADSIRIIETMKKAALTNQTETIKGIKPL